MPGFCGEAAGLIQSREGEIARTLAMENGKSLREAEGELQFCADATRWYAEEGKRAYGRVTPRAQSGCKADGAEGTRRAGAGIRGIEDLDAYFRTKMVPDKRI